MMKRLLMTVLFFAVIAFAEESSVRPESAIPTPAEEVEISKENRDLAAKEREDWQRMRAERKQARERILSEMRNKSVAEKRAMREEMGKNREKKPRLEDAPPKNFEDMPLKDRDRRMDPPEQAKPRGPRPNEERPRR
jgi:hypothetical protein